VAGSRTELDGLASTLRIATAQASLAMVQPLGWRDELAQGSPDLEFSGPKAMATQGDKILHVLWAKIGDQAAVHQGTGGRQMLPRSGLIIGLSTASKDLPTNLPEGLILAVSPNGKIGRMPLWLPRKLGQDPGHTARKAVWVGQQLPAPCAQPSTSPSCVQRMVRGNVITRLEKLDAASTMPDPGRAGWTPRLDGAPSMNGSTLLSLHAVAGSLRIEVPPWHDRVISQPQGVGAPPSSRRCLAERAFCAVGKGVCQVPIGVNTSFEASSSCSPAWWPASMASGPDPDQARAQPSNQKRSGSTCQAPALPGSKERSGGHLCTVDAV